MDPGSWPPYALNAASRRRRERLAERDFGMCCAYCDAFLPPEMLTVDHIVPQSRGGTNGDKNRVLACAPCNSEKGDRTPQEWMPGEVWGIAAVDEPRQSPRPTKVRAPKLSKAQKRALRGPMEHSLGTRPRRREPITYRPPAPRPPGDPA